MLEDDLVTPPSLTWHCCSATRPGPRHVVNEDAAVELADIGVFVVADGMGGHTDGALASRSIVEIIRCVAYLHDGLDARVADIEAALHSVNEALRREAASRPGDNIIIGSTVAVLVMNEHYAVCIWGGDSRIYVRRHDQIYQLTKDHTLQEEEDANAPSGILTRAVGSAETLALDRLVTTIEPDDTFLVCSDGLTKVLSDDDLNVLLAEPLEGLAARLVASAVAGGSTDDVSAILVRCAEATI
jgi:serine/threonine protein phosphatase PrpC